MNIVFLKWQNNLSKMITKLQNYLIYQPFLKYFQTFSSTDIISACKSKGLSKENFKTPVTLDSSFTPN